MRFWYSILSYSAMWLGAIYYRHIPPGEDDKFFSPNWEWCVTFMLFTIASLLSEESGKLSKVEKEQR